MKLQLTLSTFQKLQLTKQHNFKIFRYRHAKVSIPYIAPPSVKYNRLVLEGKVREDSHQVKALYHLDRLHDDLIPYSRSIEKQLGEDKSKNIVDLFSRIFGSSNLSSNHAAVPKSFYIWGGTGSGKTYLMDLFYQNLDFLDRKTRIHYSDFMIGIHHRLFELKNKDGPSDDRDSNYSLFSHKSKTSTLDVWDTLAEDIAKESILLCLDEFQITDVADAMIMKSLFSVLFQKGVVVVMTSNRPPIDLYKNGLQRDLFVPFIRLLEERAVVHSIKESVIDYRVLKFGHKIGKNVYWTPINAENNDIFEYQFISLLKSASTDSSEVVSNCSDDGRDCQESANESESNESMDKIEFLKSYKFMSFGHEVTVPKVLSGRPAAMFTFDYICGGAYGSVDYIEIARRFPVVFLSHVPELSISNRNELRRLIVLIDALYEAHVRLVMLASHEVLDLLPISAEDKEGCDYDEIFAFDRTVSRLLEMGSDDYVRKCAVVRPIGVDFIKQLNFTYKKFNGERKIDEDDSPTYDAKVQQLWSHYNLDIHAGDGVTSVDGNSSSTGVDINSSELKAKDFEIMLNDLEYVARTMRCRIDLKKSFENYLRTGIDYTSFIEFFKKILY